MNIDVNRKDILNELNFKIVRKGNNYNCFMFDAKSSDWKPLMNDYTLLTSVLGALESELGHLAARLSI